MIYIALAGSGKKREFFIVKFEERDSLLVINESRDLFV